LVERGPQSVNVKNAFATSSYLCYEAAITPSKGKGEENNKRKKKNRRIEVTNMATRLYRPSSTLLVNIVKEMQKCDDPRGIGTRQIVQPSILLLVGTTFCFSVCTRLHILRSTHLDIAAGLCLRQHWFFILSASLAHAVKP
jgi:hypothetical protein